jgi:gamma-aminobutyric acid type B receptor
VYNVLIMCSTGAAIAFIVDSKNAAFILISVFIFACTSITLCLVFLPKVLEVKKDPVGKKKQKSKNTFKKVGGGKDAKKDHLVKYHDSEDLDKKIAALTEDNKTKTNLIEQVIYQFFSLQ